MKPRRRSGAWATRTYLFLLALAALPATAEVYRWVDAQGRTHLSDRQPAGRGEKVDLPKAPPPDPSLEERRRKQRRLLDAFQEERRFQAQADDEAERAQEKRSYYCRNARQRLRSIEASRRAFEVNQEGERVYRPWDGVEKEQAMAEAREAVGKYCD